MKPRRNSGAERRTGTLAVAIRPGPPGNNSASFLGRNIARGQHRTRHTREGATTYRAKVRLKGRAPISATFTRLADARRWAQATEASVREVRYFKTAEAKRHPLGELVDRYVREVPPHKPKSGANTTSQLLWWKSRIGHVTLSDLGAAAIVQQRNALLAQRRFRRPDCVA